MNISKYSQNTVPYSFSSKDSSNNSLAYGIMQSYADQFNTLPNVDSLDLNEVTSTCNDSRQSIDDFIACVAVLNLQTYIDNYIISADFNESPNKLSTIITAYFNNQPYHTPAVTVNMITNGMLKYFTNSSNSITVINDPLPRSIADQLNDLTTKAQTGENLLMIIN